MIQKIIKFFNIFQINHKVKENSVNLIFAVTEEQFRVYNLLKENIEGSSAGTLTNDSSNIVQLVKEQYQVTFLNTFKIHNLIEFKSDL